MQFEQYFYSMAIRYSSTSSVICEDEASYSYGFDLIIGEYLSLKVFELSLLFMHTLLNYQPEHTNYAQIYSSSISNYNWVVHTVGFLFATLYSTSLCFYCIRSYEIRLE